MTELPNSSTESIDENKFKQSLEKVFGSVENYEAYREEFTLWLSGILPAINNERFTLYRNLYIDRIKHELDLESIVSGESEESLYETVLLKISLIGAASVFHSQAMGYFNEFLDQFSDKFSSSKSDNYYPELTTLQAADAGEEGFLNGEVDAMRPGLFVEGVKLLPLEYRKKVLSDILDKVLRK